MTSQTDQPEELQQKKRVSDLIPDKSLKPLRFSIVINLVIFGLSLIFYPRLQPEIPLFYSLADANDQLVNKQWLFLLPSLSLAINIIHLILIRVLKKLDDLILALFAWSTVILEVVLLLIVLRIIYIL
jgi:uncharacterized membrane protein